MSRRRTLKTIQEADYVTIGELARITGQRYSTLKYYTESGLLPFEQAEENLTRRYPRESSVQQLHIIAKLKAEGRTIAEIQEELGPK